MPCWSHRLCSSVCCSGLPSKSFQPSAWPGGRVAAVFHFGAACPRVRDDGAQRAFSSDRGHCSFTTSQLLRWSCSAAAAGWSAASDSHRFTGQWGSGADWSLSGEAWGGGYTRAIMSGIGIASLTFVCAFGGASWDEIRAAIPPAHLSKESQDVMRLGMGLVATMTALLLGLVTAAARSSFSTVRTPPSEPARRIS